MPEPLVIASTNRHKVAEIRDMLGDSLEVLSVSSFGSAPDIAETGATFSDNALLKAHGIAAWLRAAGHRALVLADDSGICVDALGGRPGVFSARFAGLNATDDDNNRHMVAELRALGREASPAHYVCVLALAHTHTDAISARALNATDPAVTWRGATLCVTGRCDGEVRTVAQGRGGFGYDPHFWIDGRTRTFADLDPEQKAARSHRGDALRRLRALWPSS